MQGREAVLETYAIFGGVEVSIPPDWEVINRNTTLFGGVSERRRRSPGESDTKTLILDGATIFGGVAVKD